MRIAFLHRYLEDRIGETNASFKYLKARGVDVLTFKKFDRLSSLKKFWKSILWIFYAPFLVCRKHYDVIYCDDSYPFYPALVKLFSPWSKVVIRLGDFHLMYNYSGLAYKILHYFEKIGWSCADKIIAISWAMSRQLYKEGFDCDVVLDPVDPIDFPIPRPSQFYDCVMFHGTLTRNKNVDLLLDAARLLPEVPFIVIGGGPDLKRLMSIAPSNVHFHGWVPFKEIHNYISTCAIGVSVRSNNPGNEYVVTSPFLQYGVMGKPCLVTRRKVFQDYKWQFDCAKMLAYQITILLKNGKSFEEGKKLREYILQNHDAQMIGQQIWEILTQRL